MYTITTIEMLTISMIIISTYMRILDPKICRLSVDSEYIQYIYYPILTKSPFS